MLSLTGSAEQILCLSLSVLRVRGAGDLFQRLNERRIRLWWGKDRVENGTAYG